MILILWEYQVHGWDLARATGQQWLPPVEATEESLYFAPAMLTGDYQGEGKAFAKPVDVPPTPDPWTACSGYPVVIPSGAAPDGDQRPDRA